MLFRELSLVKTDAVVTRPAFCLSVSFGSNGHRVPATARELFRANGMFAREDGEDFYLADDSSLLHLQPLRGEGEVRLAPAFFTKPLILQLNFWAFGLVRLLRQRGLYGLHAASVVTDKRLGLLIVGESNSGKSTLAIGLIRRGWGYLSDDAILLRREKEATEVEALAFRKHFYIDADVAAAYEDLPLGEEMLDNLGGRKRRVLIEEVYPRQYVPRCIPRVLLISHIVPQAQSSLLPLDRVIALKHLLIQSGPQWFERGTMERQLENLNKLMAQSAFYELRAGRDLYQNPLVLVRLLAQVEGAARWPEL